MQLISLLIRLCYRFYGRAVREAEVRFNTKEPPNPLTFLLLLMLYAAYNTTTDHLVNHFVVISSTYYEKSTIYKPNTVVILFNAADQIRQRRGMACTARSESGEVYSDYAEVFFAYPPVGICKWTAYIAVCQGVPNLHQLTLTHWSRNTIEIELPLRRPYSTKRQLQVATCFSPLFYNERWQLIIATLEIYRHFGVHLQVFYIQSILEDIMNLLELYRKHGNAEIEPWPSLKIGAESQREIGYDPNYELDWRNQASAHTDCLLKYKEAAEFIIIGDVDDVLIPKLGKTYLDEFRLLSASHPSAAGFTYNRYNTEVRTSRSPHDFSLTALVASARIATEWEDGKYVVNTSRVETAWLHYPGRRQPGTHMVTVPEQSNIMVHMRNWTLSGSGGHAPVIRPSSRKTGQAGGKAGDDGDSSTLTTVSAVRRHSTQITDLISEDALSAMEADFHRLMRSDGYKVFNALPSTNRYLPMIIDCYNSMFYSQGRRPTSCPGPLKCKIPPQPGVRCSVAERAYMRFEINWRTKLYLPVDSGRFKVRANGCTL